jgi:hypothetical protein
MIAGVQRSADETLIEFRDLDPTTLAADAAAPRTAYQAPPGGSDGIGAVGIHEAGRRSAGGDLTEDAPVRRLLSPQRQSGLASTVVALRSRIKRAVIPSSPRVKSRRKVLETSLAA